jgi:membrane-bound inhibitor of C-type lysozyme
MKALARAALAVNFVSVPALAAPAKQPPMNDFYQAFYNCDGGAAFLVAYNSNRPNSATITTSNNNKSYTLKKVQSAEGFQFDGPPVKFWTDGEKVTVEGTEIPFQNCKMK